MTNQPIDWKDYARDLECRLAAATARAEEAERWKSEALQVEREWDPQELAKMLGGTLGESCRMVVQREVPRLLSEVERLRKEREELEAAFRDENAKRVALERGPIMRVAPTAPAAPKREEG